MTRKYIFTLFLTAILFLLVTACNPANIPADTTPGLTGTGSSSANQRDDASNSPRPTDINLLILVDDGRVLLHRRYWPDFFPVTFGTIIHRGEELEVDPDAEAYILCDNLQLVRLPRGPQSLNSCPAVDKPDIRLQDGSVVGSSRATIDPQIPYIISPRNTRILDANPVLKWSEVQGAANYRVRIEGDGLVLWETQTASTELIYPGINALQPGRTYQLIVEVEGGLASTKEGNFGLGFQRISEEDAIQLEQSLARLSAQFFPTEMSFQYAKAFLYANKDLNAEAVTLLNSLVEQGYEEYSIYRLLGDLWWKIGLVDFADENYQLADDYVGDNVEGKAHLTEMFAEVAIARGDKETAFDLLTNAKELYQSLDSAEDIKRVELTMGQIK